MTSYHNTVRESGQSLIQFEMKAKNQDEAVLWVFEQPTISTLTPEMCLKYLQAYDSKYLKVPITSIRRSFSNLSNDGVIEMTGSKAKGDFGRSVNVWKVC